MKLRSTVYSWIAVVLLAACCFGGCNRGMPQGEVVANINLDGKAVEKGSVRFLPLDGKSPTAGGTIENGKCHVLKVAVGNHRVEIESLIIKPGTPATATVDQVETVQLIPAKYNTQSELTLDVKPGLNEPQFDLHSR